MVEVSGPELRNMSPQVSNETRSKNSEPWFIFLQICTPWEMTGDGSSGWVHATPMGAQIAQPVVMCGSGLGFNLNPGSFT